MNVLPCLATYLIQACDEILYPFAYENLDVFGELQEDIELQVFEAMMDWVWEVDPTALRWDIESREDCFDMVQCFVDEKRPRAIPTLGSEHGITHP